MSRHFTMQYDDPPPVSWDTDVFHLALADCSAAVRLKEHHATEESACEAVEPYLRAWETHAALWLNHREFQFRFVRAETVDRDPPENTVIELSARIEIAVHTSATLQVIRVRYPVPPAQFKLTPEVEAMWYHYEQYANNREPLLMMAYVCKTLFEYAGGGDQYEAALRFSVSPEILGRLATLSSILGDLRTARKIITGKRKKQGDASRLRNPTSQEKAWIEAVVKRLIERAGEVAADPEATYPMITMADLPALNPP